MPILDDLKAFRLDPTDAAQVAGAIAVLAAAPEARSALIKEWEAAAGQVMPQTLVANLLAGAA